MATTLFDDLTDVYEAMIDWPKRLANEEPFYRRRFEQVGVRSVADVACGTGRHAALFHSWGLRVEGSDLSPTMIERARSRFGEPPGLRWAVRGFDAPPGVPELEDAVLCVGNSLALAPDAETVARVLRQMLAALRTGGLLVVHVLNLWRLPEGPCQWQKCLRTTLTQGETLILKGVHRCGSKGYVELLVMDPAGGLLRSDAAVFQGLECRELESLARESGAGQVQFFGGYDEQPYVRHQSTDLLLVARKGRPPSDAE